MQAQQQGGVAALEQQLAQQREAALARSQGDAQQIAELQAQLEAQRTTLAEARQRLAEWELEWNELSASTIQRAFCSRLEK